MYILLKETDIEVYWHIYEYVHRGVLIYMAHRGIFMYMNMYIEVY
jgi:hypothetical protein